MSSDASPVTVQQLDVKRIAGVTPDSGFTLEELPAGLVLIHGPNGCGKSTTAAAIQSVLWPEATPGDYLDLRAVVTQEGDRWELEARGTRVSALRGTEKVPHPAWTAPELRGRYHWSLQTLLEGQDGDLAAALAAEMAGGVDFHMLARHLGWEKTPSAPQKLSRELKDLHKRQQQLRRDQEELQNEAGELRQQRNLQKQLAAKRDRAPCVDLALERIRKQHELQELESRLAGTPEGVKQFRPGDEERTGRLLEQIQSRTQALKQLHRQQEEIRDRHPLPDFGGEDEDLKHLRRTTEQFLAGWQTVSRERDRSEEERAAAEAHRRRLQERLRISGKPAPSLEGYDLPEFRTWSTAVFETRQAEVQLHHLQEQLLLELEEPLPDAEDLQDLRSQLRGLQDRPGVIRLADHLPFGISLIVLSAVVVFLTPEAPVWIPALIPGLILFQMIFSAVRKRMSLQQCSTLLRRILPEEELTPDTLRPLLRTVERLQEEPALRQQVKESVSRVEKHAATLEQAREAFQALGVEARAETEWLLHFVEDLQQWREAADQTARAEAVLAEQEKRLDMLLASLRSVARSLGRDLTRENPELDAVDLRDCLQEALTCRQELRSLKTAEREALQQREEAETELAEVKARLGLERIEPADVERLAGLHADWEEQFRNSEVLRHRGSELRKQLEETDPELLDLEEPALRALEQECRSAAEEEADVRDRISKLEQRIESAGIQRGLHETLEALQEKQDELEAERSRQAEVLAGQAILEWLRESCRVEEQPEMLAEANRLLSRFTRGALQLSLDLNAGGNAFRAARPGEDPRPLEALSTGERTQVLMAARLAFLSQQERAPLPLLIDEALGTSDDERSEAIMRTLLTVVKTGRQVFYFTAQSDEVGKWMQVLDEAEGVPFTRIDLQAQRTATPPRPVQLPAELPHPRQDVRRRRGENDAEWAARLGVPAWSGHDPVETLPLFLLLAREEETLTDCLEFGLRTWGPLQQLIRAGAAGELVSDELAETLELRTSALEALASAWRIGRPPPVDPASVMESGIVSDAFADDVLSVLRDTGYDARTFVEALENKAVQRWRQDNTEQLRALFYQQGTLTNEDPLDGEHLLTQARVAWTSGNRSPDALLPEEWQWLRRLLQTSPPAAPEAG